LKRSTPIFDATYLMRLKDGEEAAWQEFVDYFTPVIHVLLRKERTLAHVIVELRQETFARVVRLVKEDKVREPGKIPGIVAGVCRNVFKEHCRSEGPLKSSVEELATLPDPNDTLLDWLETAELQKLVQRCISSVSEPYRTALQRVWIEERDRLDVCRELKVSRDGLRTKLFRAREQFEKLYEEYLAGLGKNKEK